MKKIILILLNICLSQHLITDSNNNDLIMIEIESIKSRSLFEDCPKELEIYMNYCRNLNFDENPDYKFLLGLFSNLEKQYIDSLVKGN